MAAVLRKLGQSPTERSTHRQACHRQLPHTQTDEGCNSLSCAVLAHGFEGLIPLRPGVVKECEGCYHG